MDSINAAFWTMIFLQTMGSVDMPGHGPRKMPSPRAYVATIALFGTLSLIADAGAERAASVSAWVTVLAGVVLGPFGNKLTGFYNAIADNFATQPISSTAPVSAPTVPYPRSA